MSEFDFSTIPKIVDDEGNRNLRSSPFELDNRIAHTLKFPNDESIDEEVINQSYSEYVHDRHLTNELDNDSYVEDEDEDYLSESDVTVYDSEYDSDPDINLKIDNNDQYQSGNFTSFKLAILSFLSTIIIAIVYYTISNPININIPIFNQRFNEIDERLLINEQTIQSLQNELNNLKSSTREVMTRNGQIQITPEFHQFLSKFITNYQNQQLNDKLSSLQAKIESFESNSEIDPFYEESMLKFVSPNSPMVDYADYKFGGRILGFLTTKFDNSTLIDKLLFGWWMKNEYDEQQNANHVILNDDMVWKNGNQIGIRLSKSIIPTDILIETSNATSLVIGFKPKTKLEYDKLLYPSFEENISCKFKKIKEYQLSPGLNHIKSSIEFINYGIGGRDVYFNFSKKIDIKSIKIYGIDLASL